MLSSATSLFAAPLLGRLQHTRSNSSRAGCCGRLRVSASHSVTLLHKGKEHVLTVGNDESILDAALKIKLDISHDCKMGVCMTCPGKLIKGDVSTGGSMLSDDVSEQGYVLLCCAVPTTDCKVETIPEDELLELQLNG